MTKFLVLSGLPNATIPPANVYGDLPNDYADPGGEAQLDIEYIMVSLSLTDCQPHLLSPS